MVGLALALTLRMLPPCAETTSGAPPVVAMLSAAFWSFELRCGRKKWVVSVSTHTSGGPSLKAFGFVISSWLR